MERLTETNLELLLGRHAQFEDCLLRRVELRFVQESGSRHVVVQIDARDYQAADGWGQVLLEFRAVGMLNLLEDRTTNVVLGGIEWIFGENDVVADFSPIHSDEVISTFIVEAQEVWFESTPDPAPAAHRVT